MLSSTNEFNKKKKFYFSAKRKKPIFNKEKTVFLDKIDNNLE